MNAVQVKPAVDPGLAARLRARSTELEERLARLQRDAQRQTEPLVGDFSEQATQRQNDEVIDRLRENTQHELAALRQALLRLEDGRYGDCAQCGRPIETARLRILPYTSHCLACAAALDAAPA